MNHVEKGVGIRHGQTNGVLGLGYCFTPYQRLWLYNGAPLVAFYDTLGIRRTYSRLKPPASSRGKDKWEETCNPHLFKRSGLTGNIATSNIAMWVAMETWILSYLDNSVPTHLQYFCAVVKHIVYWVAMEMCLLSCHGDVNSILPL